MDKGEFVLGGVSSKIFNIIVTEPPSHVFAEREYENVKVPGRSGDLTIDSGRYKNTKVPYKCVFVPERGQNLRDLVMSAQTLLGPTAGYRRLENSFVSDRYYMARIKGDVSVESIVERAGIFTVNFDCDPRAFLLSGESPVTFTGSGTINNPTAYDSQPLILVTGTAAGTVSVNGTTVEIKSLSGTLYLDCENENAYALSAGTPINKNSTIYAPSFPVLSPGSNGVKFTGGITSMQIIPRWWEL